MKLFAYALSAGIVAMTVPAQASIINLIDGVNSTSGTPFINEITEVSDGVTFVFTATDNLVGSPRWLNIGNGLHVGGGGGSTIEFEMTVSEDIIFTGFITNQGGGFSQGDPAPIFDLLDGTTVLIDDGAINFSTATVNNSASSGNVIGVLGRSIALTAGTTYTFDINNTSAGTQGFFTEFTFDKVDTGVVPLPAGLPLMLGGLAALGIVGRRRKS